MHKGRHSDNHKHTHISILNALSKRECGRKREKRNNKNDSDRKRNRRIIAA